MDARAMEPHEWDECGLAIAKLFALDHVKHAAIVSAWLGFDEEQQTAIHEAICGSSRDPYGVELARDFEALAARREERMRREQQQRNARVQAAGDPW